MRATSSPMKPITGHAPSRKNRSPVPKLTMQTAVISTMKPLGPSERCGVSTALKREGFADCEGSCGAAFAICHSKDGD